MMRWTVRPKATIQIKDLNEGLPTCGLPVEIWGQSEGLDLTTFACRTCHFRLKIAFDLSSCRNCSKVMQAAAHHRLILFFRNDLRLRDNSIVHEAAKRIRNKEATDVSGLMMD